MNEQMLSDNEKSRKLGRPVGPLHMTLSTRAKRAQRRRSRGKRGRWLSREPMPLGVGGKR